MRAVIDTNVVISGLFWKGAPAEILASWLNEDFIWIVSAAILLDVSRYVATSNTRATTDCRAYGDEFARFIGANFPSNKGLNTWSVYHETYVDGEGCGFDLIFDANDSECSQSIDEFAKTLSDLTFFGHTPSVARYLTYYVQADLKAVFLDRSSPASGYTVYSSWTQAATFSSYFAFKDWVREASGSFQSKELFLSFTKDFFGSMAGQTTEEMFPKSNAIVVELNGRILLFDGRISDVLLGQDRSTFGRDCHLSATGYCW